MAEGHRARMRTRFYKEGMDSFEPQEVLEMILYYAIPRRDTRPLACKLIERFGSFHGVIDAPKEALSDAGLSDNAIAILKTVSKFSSYYTSDRENATPILFTSTDVGNYAVSRVGERTEEIFAVITLTERRQVINFEILAEGAVSTSCVTMRKIVSVILRDGASEAVFVHTHPGGSIRPSSQDDLITKEAQKVLSAMNIKLTDHIIVANGRFTSMAQLGRL